MTNLTVAFRNFAKAPKKLKKKSLEKRAPNIFLRGWKHFWDEGRRRILKGNNRGRGSHEAVVQFVGCIYVTSGFQLTPLYLLYAHTQFDRISIPNCAELDLRRTRRGRGLCCLVGLSAGLDAHDKGHPWKQFNPFRPALALFSLNATQGLR